MQIIRIATFFFIALVFQKCTSIAHVSGRYSNLYADIAGQEFRFTQAPNTFEYYSRTEGMVRVFSMGTWEQIKKTILLNGFNDRNIDFLNVENTVEEYPSENKDKIVVKYKDDPLDTFTKVDVIINGNSKIRIQGDTTFFTDVATTTLQVKSYLAHEGVLLGTIPSIDTLKSRQLQISDINAKHKFILLKIDVPQKYFYKVNLTDTLTVKDNRTLRWHNKEFRKMRE